MNLLLLIEAMKFHKVKQEMAVRILFVFCYMINIGIFFFPGSDPDLTVLFRAMEQMAQGEFTLPAFTSGNQLFIGLTFAASLLTILCTFTYAALFAGGHEGLTTRQIVVNILRSIPALIATGILLIVPAVFSSFLLFIPMIFILMILYFLPLNLILGRMRVTEAMSASARDTRRARVFIFLQYMMLMIVMNLPESMILTIFQVRGLAGALISAFFLSATALMRGRLMGMFYLNLVKKVPVMIPSKPNV